MSQPKTENSKPVWKVLPHLRKNAKRLRRDQTDAERAIWFELRHHRLNGAGFRRQVPIGPYIADLVCHAARLVIEIDGGQHFSDDAEAKDAVRTAYLDDVGFRILRFSNLDVMMNKSGVLETIKAVLDQAPTPTLPRKRERGRASSR